MTTNYETVTLDADFLAFARAFTTAFPNDDPWWDLLEKPHKWDVERAAWIAAGRPLDHGDEGWGQFIDVVNGLAP